MTRTRHIRIKSVPRLALAGIILLLIASLIIIGGRQALSFQELGYHTIRVTKGDTLWGIAGRLNESQSDIREIVYKIKKLNNMQTSAIYEGQILTVLGKY